MGWLKPDNCICVDRYLWLLPNSLLLDFIQSFKPKGLIYVAYNTCEFEKHPPAFTEDTVPLSVRWRSMCSRRLRTVRTATQCDIRL